MCPNTILIKMQYQLDLNHHLWFQTQQLYVAGLSGDKKLMC